VTDAEQAPAPSCRGLRSCGTPSGWRTGCRAGACRTAHNQDTRDYRRAKASPPPEQVEALAAGLARGADVSAAARSAGINPQTARTLAKSDPRVTAVLADQPATKAERQTRYLQAILTPGTSVTQAAEEADVSRAALRSWRRDATFAAAEQALLTWRTSATPGRATRHRRTVTPEQIEAFFDALASDPTLALTRAARMAGIDLGAIHYRADRDPDTAARLQALRPGSKRPILSSPTRDLPEIRTDLKDEA
jgi:transposase-like protein